MGGSANLQRICAASPMVVLFLSILVLPLSKGARQERWEKQRRIERQGRRTGRTFGIKTQILSTLVTPSWLPSPRLRLSKMSGECGLKSTSERRARQNGDKWKRDRRRKEGRKRGLNDPGAADEGGDAVRLLSVMMIREGRTPTTPLLLY